MARDLFIPPEVLGSWLQGSMKRRSRMATALSYSASACGAAAGLSGGLSEFSSACMEGCALWSSELKLAAWEESKELSELSESSEEASLLSLASAALDVGQRSASSDSDALVLSLSSESEELRSSWLSESEELWLSLPPMESESSSLSELEELNPSS